MKTLTSREIKGNLETRFSLSELKDLMFDLGLPSEDISPHNTSKKGTIINLIQYCERHGKMNNLVYAMHKSNTAVPNGEYAVPENVTNQATIKKTDKQIKAREAYEKLNEGNQRGIYLALMLLMEERM